MLKNAKIIEIGPSLDMPLRVKVLIHNALMLNEVVTTKVYISVNFEARGFSFQI